MAGLTSVLEKPMKGPSGPHTQRVRKKKKKLEKNGGGGEKWMTTRRPPLP